MGTQKLKAAVISAGMIANSGHIPAYKAFSQDVSLEAVCDLNASAARDTDQRRLQRAVAGRGGQYRDLPAQQ